MMCLHSPIVLTVPLTLLAGHFPFIDILIDAALTAVSKISLKHFLQYIQSPGIDIHGRTDVIIHPDCFVILHDSSSSLSITFRVAVLAVSMQVPLRCTQALIHQLTYDLLEFLPLLCSKFLVAI